MLRKAEASNTFLQHQLQRSHCSTKAFCACEVSGLRGTAVQHFHASRLRLCPAPVIHIPTDDTEVRQMNIGLCRTLSIDHAASISITKDWAPSFFSKFFCVPLCFWCLLIFLAVCLRWASLSTHLNSAILAWPAAVRNPAPNIDTLCWPSPSSAHIYAYLSSQILNSCCCFGLQMPAAYGLPNKIRPQLPVFLVNSERPEDRQLWESLLGWGFQLPDVAASVCSW